MQSTVPLLCLRVTSELDLLIKRLAQLILKKRKKKKKGFKKQPTLLCMFWGILATQTPAISACETEFALLVGLIGKALISFALCIVEVSGWL